MKSPLCLALVHLLVCATVFAQAPAATTDATNPVQLSQPEQLAPPPTPAREMKIPAGTPLVPAKPDPVIDLTRWRKIPFLIGILGGLVLLIGVFRDLRLSR